MPTPLCIKFELATGWQERQQDVEARRASERTSIRVSRSTLEAIRALCERARGASKGQFSWGPRISPDALLAAIATGALTLCQPNPPKGAKLKRKKKARPKKRHASRGSGKGMRRPRRVVKRASRRKKVRT